MKPKVFRGLQKLLADIESARGDIQATLLPLSHAHMSEAKRLLSVHSHTHAFGSHDALVAATLKVANAATKGHVLITSDRGLKAVCASEKLDVWDPLKP
jgi:hypothetical protein